MPTNHLSSMANGELANIHDQSASLPVALFALFHVPSPTWEEDSFFDFHIDII